ncbi:MAG: PIN domain-containing protein [Rhizobiaceae bacterium]|nr:PIN domain-containing protein [Rhizobiaceae bacterium]
MALLDTNILLDIATRDPQWAIWSLRAIEEAATEGPIFVSAVVYAELSIRYDSLKAVDALIESIGAEFSSMPKLASFLAAKAFVQYRAAGGARTGVSPDFFIGAHAAALDTPLLTRDARRYRTYFPDVRLISPQLN